MPVTFGSGATVDAAGAVVPPGAVEGVSTPPVDPGVPAENGVVPASDAEQAVLPGEGSAELPPASPAAPESVSVDQPTAGSDEDDEILPPPGQSRRRWIRELYRRTTHAEMRIPQLEQQLAVYADLLKDRLPASPGNPSAPVQQPLPVQPQEPAPAAVPPRYEDFTTQEEYFRALARFDTDQTVKQVLAERDQREQAQRQAEEQRRQQAYEEARQQAWDAKMAEGRQQFPDFDFVVGNPAISVSQMFRPILDASVIESPQGHAILHYLGTHPDVTQAMNRMSPYGVARLLGEIEALVRPRPADPPPAPPSRPQPAAPVLPPAPLPAPLQPVGGSQAPVSPMQFRPGMPLGDYERLREQQLPRRGV